MKDIAFFIFYGLTILGAFGAVTHKKLFYNALALGISFIGIAGIYIFLHAEFLAALQIIVYIGAIAVAIVFAIMLSDPLQKPYVSSQSRTLVTAILSILLFILITTICVSAPWPAQMNPLQAPTIEDIGKDLLTRWILPFEVISLVLLTAILGALTISGKRTMHHE